MPLRKIKNFKKLFPTEFCSSALSLWQLIFNPLLWSKWKTLHFVIECMGFISFVARFCYSSATCLNFLYRGLNTLFKYMYLRNSFKKNQMYVFGWGWGNGMHLCNRVLFGDGKNRIALQNLIYFYALLFTIQYIIYYWYHFWI